MVCIYCCVLKDMCRKKIALLLFVYWVIYVLKGDTIMHLLYSISFVSVCLNMVVLSNCIVRMIILLQQSSIILDDLKNGISHPFLQLIYFSCV